MQNPTRRKEDQDPKDESSLERPQRTTTRSQMIADRLTRRRTNAQKLLIKSEQVTLDKAAFGMLQECGGDRLIQKVSRKQIPYLNLAARLDKIFSTITKRVKIDFERRLVVKASMPRNFNLRELLMPKPKTHTDL